MTRILSSIVFRALCLGITAGMRSQTPGAVLAWRQPDAPRTAGWRSWPILRNAWGRRGLMLAGAGELVGDKLPSTPNRTDPGALTGRLLFGALAGLAIGSEGNGRGALVTGGIAGMAGAAIGTFGGYRARKGLVDITGLPDPAVAVVEDLAAISLAHRTIQRRR
jgi:uncharacterized membrane protein